MDSYCGCGFLERHGSEHVKGDFPRLEVVSRRQSVYPLSSLRTMEASSVRVPAEAVSVSVDGDING